MPEEVICALELEDLNKGANCGNNMSGVKNVYISLKDNVSHFPKLPSNRNSYEDFAVLEGDIVMIKASAATTSTAPETWENSSTPPKAPSAASP